MDSFGAMSGSSLVTTSWDHTLDDQTGSFVSQHGAWPGIGVERARLLHGCAIFHPCSGEIRERHQRTVAAAVAGLLRSAPSHRLRRISRCGGRPAARCERSQAYSSCFFRRSVAGPGAESARSESPKHRRPMLCMNTGIRRGCGRQASAWRCFRRWPGRRAARWAPPRRPHGKQTPPGPGNPPS